MLYFADYHLACADFSAAGSYGCLAQESSGHHLEIRQYFPGCVRGVRLRQQSVQGIQRHSHCKA